MSVKIKKARVAASSVALQLLPTAIVATILGALTFKDAQSSRSTCRAWRSVRPHFVALEVSDATDAKIHQAVCVACPKTTRKLKITTCPLNVTNTCFVDVAKLSGLREFFLRGPCCADPRGFEHCAQLSQLVRIDFTSCYHFTGTSISFLAHLPNLVSLSFADCDVTDDGLENVSALKSIVHLAITRNPKVNDAGLAHVATMHNLQSLNLRHCRGVTDQGFLHVAQLRDLTALDVAGCKAITEAGLAHISMLACLRKLDLRLSMHPAAQNVDLSSIAALPLEELHLSFHRCNAESFTFAIPTLRRLSCTLHPSITDEMLAYWASIPHLTHLHSDWAATIDVSGLRHFKGHAALQSLHLNSCDSIDDEAVRCVSEITCLQELNLSCCYRVTDAGLMHLAKLSHLTKLTLSPSMGVHLENLKAALPELVISGI